MTLNITIEDYVITSDGYNIVVNKKSIVDPTKAPNHDPKKHSSETREVIKPWKFCSTIDHALNVILNQKVLDSNATSLKELRSEIQSFKKLTKRLLD